MKRTVNIKKQLLLFATIVIGTMMLFFLDIMFGSVNIPLTEIIKSFTGNTVGKQSWQIIIQDFRLPKAITALLAGSGLSVAGLLMQTLFRNPLAGPHVLGISNGASMGVALLVMASSVFFGNMYSGGSWAIILASITGSMMVMFLVLLTSVRVSDNISLLIIGIMFGSLTGAVVTVLQYFSSPELIKSYLIWTFGSLGGVSWEQLQIMIPVIISGLIIAFSAAKSLNALLLGNNYAIGLGISLHTSRIIVMTATSILAGTITAFCGPIAFIGLAVPHLARILLNTSDHKLLIPAASLLGATVMLLCDLLSQAPGNNKTLPINAVTALIGSPAVIWVIIKSKNLKAVF